MGETRKEGIPREMTEKTTHVGMIDGMISVTTRIAAESEFLFYSFNHCDHRAEASVCLDIYLNIYFKNYSKATLLDGTRQLAG